MPILIPDLKVFKQVLLVTIFIAAITSDVAVRASTRTAEQLMECATRACLSGDQTDIMLLHGIGRPPGSEPHKVFTAHLAPTHTGSNYSPGMFGQSVTSYFHNRNRVFDGLYEYQTYMPPVRPKAIILDHYGGYDCKVFPSNTPHPDSIIEFLSNGYAVINFTARDFWQEIYQGEQFKKEHELLTDTMAGLLLFLKELKQGWGLPVYYYGASFGGGKGALLNLLLSNYDNLDAALNAPYAALFKEAFNTPEFADFNPRDLLNGIICHDGGYDHLWKENIVKYYKLTIPMQILHNFDDKRCTIDEALLLIQNANRNGTRPGVLQLHLTPQGALDYDQADATLGSTSLDAHFWPQDVLYYSEYCVAMRSFIERRGEITDGVRMLSEELIRQANLLYLGDEDQVQCTDDVCKRLAEGYRIYYGLACKYPDYNHERLWLRCWEVFSAYFSCRLDFVEDMLRKKIDERVKRMDQALETIRREAAVDLERPLSESDIGMALIRDYAKRLKPTTQDAEEYCYRAFVAMANEDIRRGALDIIVEYFSVADLSLKMFISETFIEVKDNEQMARVIAFMRGLPAAMPEPLKVLVLWRFINNPEASSLPAEGEVWQSAARLVFGAPVAEVMAILAQVNSDCDKIKTLTYLEKMRSSSSVCNEALRSVADFMQANPMTADEKIEFIRSAACINNDIQLQTVQAKMAAYQRKDKNSVRSLIATIKDVLFPRGVKNRFIFTADIRQALRKQSLDDQRAALEYAQTNPEVPSLAAIPHGERARFVESITKLIGNDSTTVERVMNIIINSQVTTYGIVITALLPYKDNGFLDEERALDLLCNVFNKANGYWIGSVDRQQWVANLLPRVLALFSDKPAISIRTLYKVFASLSSYYHDQEKCKHILELLPVVFSGEMNEELYSCAVRSLANIWDPKLREEFARAMPTIKIKSGLWGGGSLSGTLEWWVKQLQKGKSIDYCIAADTSDGGFGDWDSD